MKKDKIKELIYVLKHSSTWVPSSTLAKMIGVSERTVRNYVNELNEQKSQRIESSKNGYRLRETMDSQEEFTQTVLNTRENHILSSLLSEKSGTSIYDLAEELFISDSTILNSVIPKIKELLNKFHISIKMQDYCLYMEGSEQNKRKLVGYIASHNNYGYFTSTETLRDLFPSFDIDVVLHELFRICQDTNLFLNNYALNNLLVHILIIIIRLGSDYSLSSNEDMIDANKLIAHFHQRKEILTLANEIASFFEHTYHRKLPQKDLQQIVILIALSVEQYEIEDLAFDKLSNFIDQEFLDSVLSIVQDMCMRYEIPIMESDFLLQFTLHMYNVYQRASFHISYPNPIALQIKKDYAPIYDMAVFFAHRFAITYTIDINEDEIAFIAFHIGAYLEKDKKEKEKAQAIIIVENYHNFAKNMVKDIESSFQKELSICNVMSLNRYAMQQPTCDLILTTVQTPIVHPHMVLINPILTKQNRSAIWHELTDIEEEKQAKHARLFLKRLLHPNLYVRNIKLKTPGDYIEYLGNLCLKENFIQPEFIKDVLVRESISSTAFTETLAIPHAINQYAETSFICVLHNDTPIDWGRHHVQFVLMIGIAETDMKYFNDAFNLIIELYSSMNKTIEILNTTSFDEFQQVFIS